MTTGPRNRARYPVACRNNGKFQSFPLTRSAMDLFEVDELIQLVAQEAGISSAQAAHAVAAMLGYLTARLPSPVVGRIREQLDAIPSPRKTDSGGGSVE
jgi:hypothetical protein